MQSQREQGDGSHMVHRPNTDTTIKSEVITAMPRRSINIAAAAKQHISTALALLDEANRLLRFRPSPDSSPSVKATEIEKVLAQVSPTQSLLEVKRQPIQRHYDRWESLVDAIPLTDPSYIAEQNAFSEMANDPQGLIAVLDHISTSSTKLTFLKNTCIEELAHLSTIIGCREGTTVPTRPVELTATSPSTEQPTSHVKQPTVVATPTQPHQPMVNQENSHQPMVNQENSHQSMVNQENSHQSMVTHGYSQQPIVSSEYDPRYHRRRGLHSAHVEVPIFDGTKGQWFEFWNLFDAAVNSDCYLSDVEKLAVLFSRLRGPAKDAVIHYKIIDANYAAVINTLKTIFANENNLEHELLTDLRQLRPPKHTATDLMKYYNDVSRILHQMSTIGLEIESKFILYDLDKPLPEESSRYQFEERKRHPVWTTDLFRKTLLSEIEMLTSTKRHAQPEERQDRNRMDRSWEQPTRNELSRRQSSAFTTIPQAKWSKNHTQTGSKEVNPRITRTSPPSACAFCGGNHWQFECNRYKTVEQRKHRAQELELCFRCLRKGHSVRDCRAKMCSGCGGNHSKALCTGKSCSSTGFVPTTMTSAVNIDSKSTTTTGACQNFESTSLLLWLRARAFNPISKLSTINANIFLDQGSQCSFISEKLANRLGLNSTKRFNLAIQGVGSDSRCNYQSSTVEIGIAFPDGSKQTFEALTLPTITKEFLHASVVSSEISELWHHNCHELTLPLYFDEPDILIGSNFISKINPRVIKHLPSGFALYESELGPMIGGHGKINPSSLPKKSLQASTVIVGSSQYSIADLWSLDVLGINLEAEQQEDDTKAQQSFNNTLTRLSDGRYSVSWPWRYEQPRLANNFGLCVGRLQSLLRHLRSNNKRLEKYSETIQQQVETGIIELAPNTPSGPYIHYIPHQLVWNEEKQKLRIVYDASASSPKGHSLNNNLFRGPIYLPDLTGVLLRLRTPKIAIIGDLEKAFLQVELNQPDRDVARFLWVEDPSKPISENNRLLTYRFRRVFFGAVSSPFLLAGVIRYHLAKSPSPWAKEIAANIYVDNILIGAQDESEALEAYNAAKDIFEDAKMNLCDFSTNSNELRSNITCEKQHTGKVVKVLGIYWDTNDDNIFIKSLPQMSGNVTRRKLLRFIAEHFDPLGLMSPIIIPLKAFLQNLTRSGLEWDTSTSPEQTKQWTALQSNWRQTTFTISRFIPSENIQLHAFTDASAMAYATTIYIRSNHTGPSPTSLIMTRSRIGPIQSLTIPRLELLGVLIGVRLLNFVSRQMRIVSAPKFLWCDSRCVLAWIDSGKEEKLPRFVQNRLEEIRHTTDIQYAYVKSEENPADIATRGLTPTELNDSLLWWHGPTWLSQSQTTWPSKSKHALPLEFLDDVTTTEEVENVCASTPNVEAVTKLTILDPARFSSFTRLANVTAYVLRFLQKTSKKHFSWQTSSSTLRGSISGKEYRTAERSLFRQAQSDALKPEDISRWDLKPDSDGLWRCCGRLTNADTNHQAKYPIFLPRHHRITHLYILHHHIILQHAGIPATLTRIRQSHWISKGRATVKNVIHNQCFSCRRWTAKPFQLPAMPALPEIRVTMAPAFQCTAVDYFGPIIVQHDNSYSKRWIALFTCLCTRAIHLEPIEDLSTEGFLHTLRRFMARRGTPREILSDNGTNFKKAAGTLKLIPSANSVHWSFITAFAPWKGGIYERLIGLTKSSLRRAIGKQQLDDRELRTLVTEAEAILNERPITYIEEESLKVLRPIDYLQPAANLILDVSVKTKRDVEFNPHPPSTREELLDQWTRTEKCRQQFWKLWQNEYFHLLREREQHRHNGPHGQTRREPRIGEVVLLRTPNTPRANWKLARISATPVSSDGHIRSVKIDTDSTHTLTRPISEIYALEVTEESPSIKQPEPPSDNVQANRPFTRSMARATTTTNESRVAKTSNNITAAMFFTMELSHEWNKPPTT